MTRRHGSLSRSAVFALLLGLSVAVFSGGGFALAAPGSPQSWTTMALAGAALGGRFSQSAPPSATATPAVAESGGYAPSFTVGGAVASPATYALSDLQVLPAETVTARYDAGHGPETHTFQGVRLYDLLMAAMPQFADAVKNNPIDWYVNISAIDGYQAVIAWGELDPQNEGKDVIVAYSQDGQLLGPGYGMAELIVPGDATNGRYVASITSITLSPAAG
jgi:DMSO/TMAO reductase YedYZ molybdopterin-dependent catalytic subunit